MVHEHVINYLKGIEFIIGSMPQGMKVSFISALIAFGGMIYGIIISPIIFNYILIPRIEEKIGKELGYHPFLDYIFLGKWMYQQNEIAIYIVNRYLALKLKNDRGLPLYCNRFALKKVGYTIDQVSKCEIFMSIVLFISMLVVVIASLIALIASGKFTIFYYS